MHILVASIENQQYAFDLALVERTLLAVEFTPLPNAPSQILGAISVHGSVTPVINLRQLFHLPEKSIEVNDHFIICKTASSSAALWVDHVIGVIMVSDDDLIPTAKIASQLPFIQCVIQKDDQMIWMMDLPRILQLQPQLIES